MTVLRPMPSCLAKARVGGNEQPLESRPLRMPERRIAYNCRCIGTDEPRSMGTLSNGKLARFIYCRSGVVRRDVCTLWSPVEPILKLETVCRSERWSVLAGRARCPPFSALARISHQTGQVARISSVAYHLVGNGLARSEAIDRL